MPVSLVSRKVWARFGSVFLGKPVTWLPCDRRTTMSSTRRARPGCSGSGARSACLGFGRLTAPPPSHLHAGRREGQVPAGPLGSLGTYTPGMDRRSAIVLLIVFGTG